VIGSSAHFGRLVFFHPCTVFAAVTIAPLDKLFRQVLNNHSRKNSSRSFPHNKIFCASMPI
jgi:hypothetical protein